MTWLGVSSPPKVRAVPVKREDGALGSSPPGLETSLNMFVSYKYIRNVEDRLTSGLFLVFYAVNRQRSAC